MLLLYFKVIVIVILYRLDFVDVYVYGVVLYSNFSLFSLLYYLIRCTDGIIQKRKIERERNKNSQYLFYFIF